MGKGIKKPIRICHIATSHYSLGNLFRGQHKFFAENGFEVWGVSSPGPVAERAVREEGLYFYPVDIKRSIDLWADLKALVKLIYFLRRQKFDIVEAGTGKAGMLGMVAAWLVRAHVRVFTLRGVWYEPFRGLRRKIASITDRIAGACSHRVFVVSHELLERDIREHVLNPKKSCVIGYGSSNGVDIERFSRNEKTITGGRQVRAAWKIPEDSLVLGFVGRASINKGICELAEAFKRLHTVYGDKLYLFIVGFFDYMGGMVPKPVLQYLKKHSNIKCVGEIDDVENYYAVMDILVLPTYREGFPNVSIEAAAMEVVVVASNISGCRESVSNGQTGILVEPKSTDALYEGIVKLIEDEPLRKQMASNGPKWVAERFDCRRVWRGLLQEYLRLYQQKK
jgi:glycosyltransferase involved in cell wall biosynthesis